MFSHLRKYHNTEIVFDPSEPDLDTNLFQRKDWLSSKFGHLEGKEELSRNIPQPRVLGFIMSAKVDIGHAADTVTRRSRTGFLVYLNCALIFWFSKK